MKTRLFHNSSDLVWIIWVPHKVPTSIYVHWLWLRIRYVSVCMYISYECEKKFWFDVYMKVWESEFTQSIGVSFLLVGVDRRLCGRAATVSFVRNERQWSLQRLLMQASFLQFKHKTLINFKMSTHFAKIELLRFWLIVAFFKGNYYHSSRILIQASKRTQLGDRKLGPIK